MQIKYIQARRIDIGQVKHMAAQMAMLLRFSAFAAEFCLLWN